MLFFESLSRKVRSLFSRRPAAPAIVMLDTAAVHVSAETDRKIYSLNQHWLFGGKMPDADESKWEEVTLPHANVELPWHSFDQKSFQHVSTYRRHFKADTAWQGKRVFIDFGGAMTAATVSINGHKFAEYKGGYTPFSCDLSQHLKYGEDNIITVEVDSTERADIPPFGENVDYLTFGGIYRDVSLRVVPQTFIENVHAEPVKPLSDDRSLKISCQLGGAVEEGDVLTAVVLDGDREVGKAGVSLSKGDSAPEFSVTNLPAVELWDLDHPKLYTVAVQLRHKDGSSDEYRTRVGFREAKFTPEGFMLNGRHVKLMGLNRHQNYPFVGGAMPARVQRKDAEILKKDLHCNIVRTSHYPQSPDFLDACDELGLLVLEEIPGWQHIGGKAWQDTAVRNVGEMIRRDWNHPSIVLWGVRINESPDDHSFYKRTNALAHALDKSRQTGGIRCNYDSELLEDVFTYNDFGFPLKQAKHPLYLVSEFNGHMFPTKRFDNVSRVMEHVLRHARVFNQVAGDKKIAGGIGWCAFDYNTHDNFGSGDNICYHGVADIFRVPKAAGFFYKSQCEPSEEVVLEAGFFWSLGDRDEGGGPARAPILSNCDRVKIYYAGKLLQELSPDRENYPNLKHPPFMMDLGYLPLNPYGDLKIEGYINGKLVKTQTLSGSGRNAELKVLPDDVELKGDGRDATRVLLEITDEYGNIKPLATGAVELQIEGPGKIVGENPFALSGGVGAVWVKAAAKPGTVKLTAKHATLGTKTVEIKVSSAPQDVL